MAATPSRRARLAVTRLEDRITPTARVGAYYTEWSTYDRNYQVTDIPADKLTHLIYSFAQVQNNQVTLRDPYAALQKPFPDGRHGNLEELQALKAAHPQLKTLIAVGGWTLSDPFPALAASAASRTAFVNSAVAFIRQYGFDGVDIDWEFPVSGGLSAGTAADKHNFTLLLQDLRAGLNAAGAADGKAYLLTAAIGAGAGVVPNYEISAVAQALDWIDVMSYDYHGSGWEKQTNHQAALTPDPADPSSGAAVNNQTWSVQQFLNAGVPAAKLQLGVPLYGRSWQNVPAGATHGLYQTSTGTWNSQNITQDTVVGPGTWERGVFDYKDLYNRLQAQPSAYQRYWDAAAQVPYVYATSAVDTSVINPTTGQRNNQAMPNVFSTYEDVQSLALKTDYVKQQGLGGVFFWELSGDLSVSNPDSLVRRAADALQQTPAVQTAYVNAAWAGMANGSDPDGSGPATSIGTDAFATIQAGVNAVAAGGTVNVLGGNFAENVNLNKANVTVQVPASGGSPVVINPAAGDAVTVSAGGVTVTGNNRLTVAGNSALGRAGVRVSAAGATLQGLTVSGFSGAGSYGVVVSGAGAAARLLSDNISGNAVGVLVNGAAALLQGNTLANNTTQGGTSAGLYVQSGGRVDAGGGDGAGLGAASTGGNTFAGYTPGGALAVINLNGFQAVPEATGAVSTAAGNVALKNNTFSGAASYAQVEAVVFHRLDGQFPAYADYRGAAGAGGALAAPAADPASFRFLAAATDRTDPFSAVQRSVIRGISFQISGPVALNAGQTLAALLSVVRESPASAPGYAAGGLPANNTALAAGAFDLANSFITIDGTSGLTTVTLRFLNSGAYAGGGSANMTEYGSLIDGVYRATVNGASASLLFAGSGTAAASAQQRFHRLFGDVDNSGELDAADFTAIRNYLSSGSSPFRPYLDFNLSGGSDTADTTAFNARLGSSLIE